MTNTKDIIIKLKEVREEKGYSYNDILELMEKNGDFLAKSTLSRVFADGSEELSFKYEETLRPIANALLDIDTIEDDDDLDTQAMKLMLQFKSDKIRELEASLNHEKVKHHEKLEKEREQSRRSIEFLKEQIQFKDKRIDFLLEAVFAKDKQLRELFDKVMKCPYGQKEILNDD